MNETVHDMEFRTSNSNFEEPNTCARSIPRRGTPGLCMKFVSPETEGVGNAGCPWHPRPRVHLVVAERTRATTSTPDSPDVPARNGFNGFLRALPVTGLVCHRRPRINVVPKPGWADMTSADLTPASGRQDHTTSPYATTSLVRSLLIAHGFKEPALRSRRAQNAAASTASAPRVRDDRDTPLVGWDGGINKAVSTKPGSEIFFGSGLDTDLPDEAVFACSCE
jgi:hypothetical protein